MAKRRDPGESGRRPIPEVTAGRPDCHRCSWVWRAGVFELKYVSAACGIHRLVADGQGGGVPLVTWLGATA